MPTRTRYRVEEGRSCIDLKLRHSGQLFDGRDPAPFRERDLDDDAVDYLLAAAQEIPRKEPLTIVVTISEEPEPRLAPDAIVEAVAGHFRYERQRLERRLRARSTRRLPHTGGTHRVAPRGTSAGDSSRGTRHHRMGRDVAAARSPALRLVADGR